MTDAESDEKQAVRIEALAERLSDAGGTMRRGPEILTREKGSESYHIPPSGAIAGNGQFRTSVNTLVGTYHSTRARCSQRMNIAH